MKGYCAPNASRRSISRSIPQKIPASQNSPEAKGYESRPISVAISEINIHAHQHHHHSIRSQDRPFQLLSFSQLTHLPERGRTRYLPDGFSNTHVPHSLREPTRASLTLLHQILVDITHLLHNLPTRSAVLGIELKTTLHVIIQQPAISPAPLLIDIRPVELSPQMAGHNTVKHRNAILRFHRDRSDLTRKGRAPIRSLF